jgi:hypothetical protein
MGRKLKTLLPAAAKVVIRDLLAGLLQNNGTLYITALTHAPDILIIRKTDQAAIMTEYVFEHNSGHRRADIAYLENGQIKYIVEVGYTRMPARNRGLSFRLPIYRQPIYRPTRYT